MTQDIAQRVSECTLCPPWVVRCAHLDDGHDTRAWLVDWMDESYPHAGFVRSKRRYGAFCGYSTTFPLCECQCPDLWWEGPPYRFEPPLYTGDKDAAQAEFNRRAEELLKS